MKEHEFFTKPEFDTTSKILESILNGMDAYLYVTDPTTDEILFINDKMRQHFSFEHGGVGEICWKVLQKGMTQRCEFCPNYHLAKAPNDTVVWEEHNTVTHRYYRNSDKMIMWPDGRMVHLQHSVDITDAKEIENELITARDTAREASKAKSEFLARMSHEIRTPLNAIIGMTSIGIQTADRERKDYCFSKIESASLHLVGVINDILDMSKIEANKFEIINQDFDFEKMLLDTTNIITFRVDEKNHNLIVDFERHIPRYVHSDEQRIAQVLTNLLSNAVKFTPDNGTIKLSVKIKEEEEDNLLLEFIVSDNGIGISAEQQSKLFSLFEQADGGKSRKFQGTGLGLAICKKIVELMGGTIWIDSALNQGTTIGFVLRVKKSKKVEQHPDINYANLKILAVDDSLEIRNYFAELMESLKIKCDVASSGEEALAMIEQYPYNIFFIDWQMPNMNGIELAKRIKAHSNQSIIIMISAARWSDIAPEAIEAGASRFVAKPLFPSSIIDCIHECVGLKLTPRSKKQDEIPDYSSYTFLLAEDIEINREIVTTLLENTKVKFLIATNGEEAYQLTKKYLHEIDLIFMDIHMPLMDGYEATKLIKQLEGAQNLPIIAMTANAFKEDIERCLEAKMSDHIAKPLDYQELMDKIKRNLKLPLRESKKEGIS